MISDAAWTSWAAVTTSPSGEVRTPEPTLKNARPFSFRARHGHPERSGHDNGAMNAPEQLGNRLRAGHPDRGADDKDHHGQKRRAAADHAPYHCPDWV